ncbi:protein of unknown function [Microlunatus sagamiharensis]|uniref:DUF4307 domain-containing protein n=1 Tax=Microlunatus sagamiharensis TaxID=546874 RepID=A0A1H2MUG7_9ACTN|nr:DUF4307 domain-containing protein [Microlunatus sagamiharensis]SDU96810.1 protein of unknown function [Microlunatus sagamiharensis]
MTVPTTLDPAAAERLARRYPPPRVNRRTKALMVAVATLVALGWLVWAALLHAEPAVTGQVASYKVLSDTSIQVEVTVQRRDPSKPASCRLLVQSTDFQPVAEQSVEVGPSQFKVVDTNVTLTTLRRATAPSIKSCTSS